MTPITPEWLRKIAGEVEKDPKRWTNTTARDAAGNPVKALSHDAVAWCAWGFAVRDGIDNNWANFQTLIAGNDSCKTPAEFIAWLREMAKEMGVQA